MNFTLEDADENHDIAVKSFLTESEYLAFLSLCKETGLTQSAAIRRLIKKWIKHHLAEKCARQAGL